MIRSFVLGLAIVALLPSSAIATTCSNTDPNATEYDTDQGTFYVANDPCQPVIGDGTCLYSVWIYEESNDIAGLQRTDEISPPPPGACPGDTDIF